MAAPSPAPHVAIVLIGEAGEFRLAPDAWARLLRLAATYGWTPSGTLRGAAWCGHYAPPCGQMIRARDAAELALAIEDLLDDIPDADPPTGARSTSSLELLGGRSKAAVVRLVDFLRHGAVSVMAACGRSQIACDLR